MKPDARTYLGTGHACVDQTLSIVVRRGTPKDCLVVDPDYSFQRTARTSRHQVRWLCTGVVLRIMHEMFPYIRVELEVAGTRSATYIPLWLELDTLIVGCTDAATGIFVPFEVEEQS